MTQIALIIALFALRSSGSFAALKDCSPIRIVFAPAEIVFIKATSIRQTVEECKKLHMHDEFVLDASLETPNGKIWCKRLSDNSCKDEFREKGVDLKGLRGLQEMSLSGLIEMFGNPAFATGPIDTNGTHICGWRMFNGQSGNRLMAAQVLAGSEPYSRSNTNVVFLIISVAEGNKHVARN